MKYLIENSDFGQEPIGGQVQQRINFTMRLTHLEMWNLMTNGEYGDYRLKNERIESIDLREQEYIKEIIIERISDGLFFKGFVIYENTGAIFNRNFAQVYPEKEMTTTYK